MEILDYIIPTEFNALILVYFQWGFFAVWFFFIVKNIFRLRKIKKEIKNCGNIGTLVEITRRRYDRVNDEAAIKSLSDKLAISSVDRFLDACKVSKKSPVHTHLQALFLAGLKESEIDVPSLIDNTNSRITAPNSSLRSLLSLFIILGLLGTLIGLAATLSSLSLGNEQLTSTILEQRLQELLGKLGSAFAPSILGVFLTVLGVLFFFSFYLRRFSIPVCELLERYTLTNWAPNLLPTPNQLLVEKLQLSEQQLRANIQAAEEVAKAAPKIKNEAESLEKSVANARNTFSELDSAAGKLFEFAKLFDTSISHLPAFQDELRTVSEKMMEDSKLLTSTVTHTLNGNKEFQTDVKKHFSSQNDFFNQQYVAQSAQITNILQTLKLYEDAYVANRQSIDGKLEETLSAAKQAFEQLSQQNETIISGFADSIGEPLRESVVERLGALDPALDNIAKTLKQMNIPLQEASDKISATAEHFDKRTEKLIKHLQEDFNEQIKELRNEFRELDGKRQIQLENLQGLNEGINKLTSEFSGLSLKLERFNSKSANVGRQSPGIYKSNQPPAPKGVWGKIKRFFRR